MDLVDSETLDNIIIRIFRSFATFKIELKKLFRLIEEERIASRKLLELLLLLFYLRLFRASFKSI